MRFKIMGQKQELDSPLMVRLSITDEGALLLEARKTTDTGYFTIIRIPSNGQIEFGGYLRQLGLLK